MAVIAPQEIELAYEAAQCVRRTHEALVEFIRPGQTLAEIDAFIGQTLASMNCKSCFLRYRIPGNPPFPSHACLSLNDCIVHGQHNTHRQPLEPGDLLSIDIGTRYRGWIGDAAWTYAIQFAEEETLRLMQCGRESLARGIQAMQPNRPLIDWAKAVQNHVEDECGFHLVRGLGGHGYGRKLHGPPFISNVVPRHRAEWPDAWKVFEPGQLLAVEPMIAIGSPEIMAKPRQWPIYTADGSLSVHHEANVLITEDGPRNLTEGMENLPDIIGT